MAPAGMAVPPEPGHREGAPVTDVSLAQAAAHLKPTPQPLEVYAETIEKELARLAEARPHLSDRIGRAAQLVVVQLSSSPRNRPIRCRIRKGGRCVVLVESLTSRGVVYEINPATWRCSCPDAHRRDDAPCKHSLAGWVVYRASLTPAAAEHVDRVEAANALAQADEDADEKGGGESACSHCMGSGWIYMGEEIVDPGSGEVAEAVNPVRCRRCGDGPTHDDVQRWLESQRWIFARSRPNNPHSYCLRREAEDERMFEKVVEHVREYGSPYPWWGRTYDQYVAGEYCYWTMGAPIPETVLINRKSLEQVRLDQLTNKGGGGIVWPWLHHDVEAEREELRRQEQGQDELGAGA